MIELIAALLTLACVLLLNMKNKLGWSVGILAAIAYFFVFYQQELYGQVSLQIVFILQSIYGWWLWNKDSDELKIDEGSHNIWLVVISWVMLMVCVWFITLEISFNNSSQSIVSIRILDYTIVGLALFANYLLNLKILKAWYVWIIVDVLSIGLFIYTEMWWTLMLYLLLLTNAVNASIKWKRELE